MKLKYFYQSKKRSRRIGCILIDNQMISFLIQLFRWVNKMRIRPPLIENFKSLQMKTKYKLKFLNKTFTWTFQIIPRAQ